MNCTAKPSEAKTISLVESLDGEWLKIPLDAMRMSGAASQTLGGILKITMRDTFVPIATIAERARLPAGTVKRHLVRLDHDGWIRQHGRERTRGGNLRRTATIAITKQTKDRLRESGYAMLPWWACGSFRKFGRFPWASKAVLAVLMSKIAKLRSAIVASDDRGLDANDIPDSIANMGDDANFRYSLTQLSAITGLHRESIVAAKKQLHHAGVIHWQANKGKCGGDGTDVLMPNWEFAVVVIPASEGRCFLELRGRVGK